MRIEYSYYDQGKVNDILFIYNNPWIVIKTCFNDDITTDLLIRKLNSDAITCIDYKYRDIQAAFRNTTIEQIKHNYPEFFI